MTPTALHEYLTRAARRFPDRVAVVEPGCGTITYAQLELLSDGVRNALVARGVRRGDRVGFALKKSIDAVAVV